MSSFPPLNWEVRFLKDMGSLACEVKDSAQPSMAAYLAVKPAGGEEGNFRFVLAGPHKIRLRFEIKNVLPSDLFNNMVAEAELEIGDQVVMERNSVCSAWMDLVELVRSQDVMITDGDDNDIADEFLAALQKYKEDVLRDKGRTEGTGICFRLILGVRGENTDVILMAQVKSTVETHSTF